MDIQHLVDRLEELIDEGRHVPATKLTLIDEERALEIIDQMRISIPEEIEKAARVLAQRDRILAQANEEAARLVQLARERGDQLVEREATVQAAKSQAVNIVEEARQEAEEVTRDADQYIMDQLSDLENQLTKVLGIVRNGINKVASSEKPASISRTSSPAQTSQYARSAFDVPNSTAAKEAE
ncbi:MAG: vacuolar-type H+-ATPase subunit H [Chloroflexi bacterium OLB15]|nr:MAG: vacuolar-type H+-ATPase subunit H [Chloroflexi bacterium OLB15]